MSQPDPAANAASKPHLREVRHARWLRRIREWRCFWTWPLGHDFYEGGEATSVARFTCRYCAKPEFGS